MRQNWWKAAVVVLLVVAVAAVIAAKNSDKPVAQSAAAEVAAEVAEPAPTAPEPVEKAEPEKQEAAPEPKAVETKSEEPKVKPAEKPKVIAKVEKPVQPQPKPVVAKQEEPKQEPKVEQPEAKPKRLPMLLELGADKCIPCKKMKPIIDSLEKEYEGRVDVLFIDVWKTEGVAEKYNIRSIPTQIFFDQEGKEYYRHQGFFPKEDILKIFADMGVK